MKYYWEIPTLAERGIEIETIKGKLQRTNRKVKPYKESPRTIYKDDNNRLWVIINGIYWRFPEDIEY